LKKKETVRVAGKARNLKFEKNDNLKGFVDNVPGMLLQMMMKPRTGFQMVMMNVCVLQAASAKQRKLSKLHIFIFSYNKLRWCHIHTQKYFNRFVDIEKTQPR
jgi:hypothetical protein